MSKNKVITTQFKLIEMSQTRARGCIEKIYPTENKTAFDLHVSVSKKPKFPRSVTLTSTLTPSLTLNMAELFA